MFDEPTGLLKLILLVNVLFLILAAVAAVAVVPPLRTFLRRSADVEQ